jgi:hypothetical protein
VEQHVVQAQDGQRAAEAEGQELKAAAVAAAEDAWSAVQRVEAVKKLAQYKSRSHVMLKKKQQELQDACDRM